MRALICENENCKDADSDWGRAVEIIGPYNEGEMQDINDWADHIRLYPYDAKQEPLVQAFGNHKFGLGHAGLFGVGEYTGDDFKNHHVDKGGYSGAISSLVIPSGLFAILYKDNFYKGDSVTIKGPNIVDLDGDKDYQGWNDQVRSMRVFKNSLYKVLCSWERVASHNGGPLSETVSIGWTSESTQENEKTVQDSFTEAVTLNAYDFMSVSLSMTHSTTVRNLARESLSQQKTVTRTFTCENPDRTRVALYQWRMIGQRQGLPSIDVFDSNYICRYGTNVNSYPICPLGYCDDDECTKCTPEFQMLLAAE